MSTYLTDRATRGEEISFTGPHGSFFLREATRPVLLLAGGTGLAPILSMLRKMHADKSLRKVHLIYGVSSDTDLVATDEIEYFADKLPGFTWDHCVSDPAGTAANKGYVMSLIRPEHLYDATSHLPLRSAAHGRGRAQARGRGRDRTHRLLLREVRARREAGD